MSIPKHLICTDCQRALPQLYMLKEDVWKLTNADSHNVCIFCIEKRLGRPLTIEDFNPTLWVNELVFFAHKMATGKDLFTPKE